METTAALAHHLRQEACKHHGRMCSYWEPFGWNFLSSGLELSRRSKPYLLGAEAGGVVPIPGGDGYTHNRNYMVLYTLSQTPRGQFCTKGYAGIRVRANDFGHSR